METEIEAVLAQLGSLKDTIPTIKAFSSGKNTSPEQLSQGYTHAFIMKFDDAQGRDFYLQHPEHKRIVSEKIAPMIDSLDSVIVIDFTE